MTLKDLLTEREYAEQRGVSLRTVQRERQLGVSPAYVKLGRATYYRRAAIEAWLRAKEVTPPRSPVRGGA